MFVWRCFDMRSVAVIDAILVEHIKLTVYDSRQAERERESIIYNYTGEAKLLIEAHVD